MTLLPEGARPPAVLETRRFRLRPITIQDVLKDHDAVMAGRFAESPGGPLDLTLRRTLLDLALHEKEFRRRSSFCYAVVSLDERRLLGRVYVGPPANEGHDAEVRLWTRADESASGLESVLEEVVRGWLDEAWPFERVAYQGGDTQWNVLPGRRVA